MFGFSLTKLLFTIAAIAAVWYGFKWMGRVQAKRDSARIRQEAEDKAGGGGRRGEIPNAEEMIKCATCGIYIAADGAGSCGRADCPYSN